MEELVLIPFFQLLLLLAADMEHEVLALMMVLEVIEREVLEVLEAVRAAKHLGPQKVQVVQEQQTKDLTQVLGKTQAKIGLEEAVAALVELEKMLRLVLELLGE
jgi:predicted ATPase with chaperone activity